MLMNHKKMRESGFTLIEVIITLVIVAIMATMFFTYAGSKSFTGSVNPIEWVKSANKIHQIIEMISADYQGYPRWKPNTPYAAGSRVTPIKRDGYFYQPPATGGCPGTGEAEPPWPSPPPATCSPSPCTVADAHGCIWTRPATTVANPNPIMTLAELRRKIAGVATLALVPNNGGEGTTPGTTANTTDFYPTSPDTASNLQYKIINNRYINPGATAGSPWDDSVASSVGYLKVTIQTADGNEKLTAIFTE
jgi:prepilin-type N-terminal cleavage/methylation domain-containing protein